MIIKYTTTFNLSINTVNNFNEIHLERIKLQGINNYSKKKTNKLKEHQRNNKTNINFFRCKPSLLLHCKSSIKLMKGIKPKQIICKNSNVEESIISGSLSSITKKYHDNYKSYDERSIQDYLNDEVKNIKLTYLSEPNDSHKIRKKIIVSKENNCIMKKKRNENNEKQKEMCFNSNTTTHLTRNCQMKSLNYISNNNNKSCIGNTVHWKSKKNYNRNAKHTFRESAKVSLMISNDSNSNTNSHSNNDTRYFMSLQKKKRNNIISPDNNDKNSINKRIFSIKSYDLQHFCKTANKDKSQSLSLSPNYHGSSYTKKIEYNATKYHNSIERIFKIVIDLRNLLSSETINEESINNSTK